MGYVESGHHKTGTKLKVQVRSKLQDAMVVKMPFVPTCKFLRCVRYSQVFSFEYTVLLTLCNTFSILQKAEVNPFRKTEEHIKREVAYLNSPKLHR
jgi:hypothetical protein